MLALLAATLFAQDMRAVPPLSTYQVHRAASPIQVDGKLDEPAWKAAPVVEFVFPWDAQKGAKQKTRARLLWDAQNLYVAYECDDTDIVANYEQRDDPTYKDDAVEIFINPAPAQGLYFGLEMNARGVLYDYFTQLPQGLKKEFNMDGVQLQVTRDGTLNQSSDKDRGWVLELAIPWKNFEKLTSALPPPAGTEWRINLNRWDGVEPNRRLSQWSDSGLEKPNPHNAARFGRIVFSSK